MRVLLMLLLVLAHYELALSHNSRPTKLRLKTTIVLDGLTVYNPVIGQCDKDPLVTASMAKIDMEKLRQGKLRWMALSRDLLKKHGGVISYGDTVTVFANDPDIDGQWVVVDTMNKRYSKRGDLLFANRKFGKWTNVRVVKYNDPSLPRSRL
jgi:hypothetical protein